MTSVLCREHGNKNCLLFSVMWLTVNSKTSAYLQYWVNKSSMYLMNSNKLWLGCNNQPLDFIFVNAATGFADSIVELLKYVVHSSHL